MLNIQHKDLADGKWVELSLVEQMGNVGSEVGRAISWQRRGDNERMQKALDRAFELIDLTAGDVRWAFGFRLKEILRAREVLADYFFGNNFYGTIPEKLERYFYYFAYAARKAR
jgi:hypothetical protein